MKGVLKWAMGITVAQVVVELVGGFLANSIALISDAVHNLTDLPTFVISWMAIRLAERPPTPEKTFGYHRAGTLAAFTNASLLVIVALYIGYESFERLQAPLPVRSGLMLGVAVFALVINAGITVALLRGRRDLNVRSLVIHNLGDALSNVAIIAGALGLRVTGADWVDPVLGLAIALLVLWSSFGILRESSHILLEGAPRELSQEAVARAILGVEGVREVHDIHLWTLGTDQHLLSCHVRIPDMHMDESEKVLTAINGVLEREFRITHSTIQFERAGLPREAGYYMPEPVNPSEKKKPN
jgi:cobalt-zinc-cadmium efflux system protein